MNRLIAALTCVLLFTACKKDAEPAPEAEADVAAEAMKEEVAAEEDAPPPPEEEEKPVEITQDLVDRYLVYWEKEIKLVHDHLERLAKQGEENKKADGTLDTMKALHDTSALIGKLEEEKAKLLQDSKMSEREAEAIRGVIASVGIGRYMMNKAGDQSAVIAEMKKNVASIPAENRAEAEKQIAEMEKGFEDMKNGAEARKEYGDAAVDLVIKNDSRILPLYEKSLTMGFGKGK